MSHTTTVQTSVTDEAALRDACEELGYTYEGKGTRRLYDGKDATGMVCSIPEWKFPVIFTEEGECLFDTYEERWGKVADLKALQRRYAVNVHKRVAAKKGIRLRETVNKEGKILLVVGGRAA